MKTALLILFSCSIITAAEVPTDGVYLEFGAGTQPIFAAISIELKQGRFTITCFNDVAGTSTDSGTYQRHGVRLVLIGDSPDFIDAWISFVYDGVAVIMDPISYREFRKNNKLGSGILVRINPDEANPAGWKRLLDSHPKFKQAVVAK